MKKETLEIMDKFIADNGDEILESVMRLARIPSVRDKAQNGAPNGKECRRCLDEALDIMKSHGFKVRVESDGLYGVAELGESDKSIGLFVHTDVVPVSPEDWIYTEPFSPVRIGDVLVGRGVEDNKSGVAIAAYATELLRAAGLTPKSKITVFLGSCEETSMADIEAFARNEKMPDVSIIPDADFPVSFGEKGICHVKGRMKRKFKDIISLSGGSAYNIVMAKASCSFNYRSDLFCALGELIKENHSLSLTKSGDKIIFTATGTPKHAAMPEGATNALASLAGALKNVEQICLEDREILCEIEKIASSFYGERLGIACSDEYFGKLTSVCGICDMTEDGYPLICLDIRYGTAIDSARVEETLRQYFDEILELNNKPGFAIPRDDKIAKSLEEIYREFSKNPDDSGFYMGGGTYARHLKNAFSVGTQASFVENQCIDLPAGHGGAHQSDEVLRINQFFKALEIIAMMIHGCDEILNG